MKIRKASLRCVLDVFTDISFAYTSFSSFLPRWLSLVSPSPLSSLRPSPPPSSSSGFVSNYHSVCCPPLSSLAADLAPAAADNDPRDGGGGIKGRREGARK